ncbi:MAG: hypothetical protein NC226_11885, partial [Bacteroides cellulosilyticus]|nr:hypothetical protein [Bacteroides cellulosilyticus]
EQTATLIKGQPLEYTGELYSETHQKQFKAENVIVRISSDEINNRKLVLKINGLPIIRWFREQTEKPCNRMGIGENNVRIRRDRKI